MIFVLKNDNVTITINVRVYRILFVLYHKRNVCSVGSVNNLNCIKEKQKHFITAMRSGN